VDYSGAKDRQASARSFASSVATCAACIQIPLCRIKFCIIDERPVRFYRTRRRHREKASAMDNLVSFERRGRIGIITIDSPPVNALGHAVRVGLVAALEEAGRDPQVEAIVLNSAGRIFTAGADIREFGKPSQ